MLISRKSRPTKTFVLTSPQFKVWTLKAICERENTYNVGNLIVMILLRYLTT